jgi:hypothetical protein
MGDMLSPERQTQIEAVVDRLARFNPTRIMVEVTPDREAQLNETYRAYLDGTHRLAANESEQLGMCLAGKLGLPMIHAVDHRQDMDFERVLVVFGSGHLSHLARFFEESPRYEFVPALRFLDAPDGG